MKLTDMHLLHTNHQTKQQFLVFVFIIIHLNVVFIQ